MVEVEWGSAGIEAPSERTEAIVIIVQVYSALVYEGPGLARRLAA